MANFSIPWVETDFRRKTGHLSKLQGEAYRALLFACFERGGVLPDDDKKLAQICDIDIRTFRKNKAVLQAFFYDGWHHRRIDEDLARIEAVHIKRSIAGQKGVVARLIKGARRR
jgi:uncharacterized protein YdaU (DUF1376 family)